MIYAAVNQIAVELNQFLKRAFDRSEDMVVVSNILEQDGTVASHIDNKVVVFLTNIEKEAVPNSLPQPGVIGGSRTVVGNVPLHLNLYLMFAAYFSGSNYPEALKSISTTMRFFQMNPVFGHQNTPDLDRRIDRLALDVENLDIPQLSNLWGILSTRYLPSVMYKVRMVTIDAGAVSSEVHTMKEPRPSLGANETEF
jgi:hypothetical protein